MSNFGNLHPWGIVFHFLMELPSDEICRIIDLTGLQVNWTINKEQEYSDKNRKRAYRSKISSAFSSIYDEEKFLTTQNVANQLAVKHDLSSELNQSLNKIGWKIISGKLTTESIDIIEKFFPKGTQHDSYVLIRNIIQKSNSSIIIIDPYIDSTIFEILGTLKTKLVIKILSYKLPSDFNSEINRFIKQHSELEIAVRITKEFHDRFIIIEKNECYHFGASIKDSGSKSHMINKIEDKNNISALIEQFEISWNTAKNP